MLISQTPFRMSFFGGGTDHRDYFDKYGGSVLSTTIDKYCYVIIRDLPPFFEYKNQVTYSKIERFNDPDEVQHPLIREALKYTNAKNVQIMYDADLPARSGLGTSSSFAVGLLNGLHSLKGDFVDKMTLAEEAIHLERDQCNEAGGVQDQLAASFGGLNRMTFTSIGYDVRPVIISPQRKKEFNDHLMLFFTGFERFSGEIAKEQKANTEANLKQLHEMAQLVDEGEKILTSGSSILDFGRMLDYTWKLKRTLSSQITTDSIDIIYEKAIKAGAVGGKLLGAGGGGFILLFVEPDKQFKVRKALSDLLNVPFQFETSGTKVIYYKPNIKEIGVMYNEKKGAGYRHDWNGRLASH